MRKVESMSDIHEKIRRAIALGRVEQLEAFHMKRLIYGNNIDDVQRHSSAKHDGMTFADVFLIGIQDAPISVIQWLLRTTGVEFLQQVVTVCIAQVFRTLATAPKADKNLTKLAILKYLMTNQIIRRDTTDDKGDTILHFAVRSGTYEMVEWLLGKYDFVGLKNKRGEDALFCAAAHDDQPREDMICILLRAGFTIQTQDERGCTPIDRILCQYKMSNTMAEQTLTLLDFGVPMTDSTIERAFGGRPIEMKRFLKNMYEQCEMDIREAVSAKLDLEEKYRAEIVSALPSDVWDTLLLCSNPLRFPVIPYAELSDIEIRSLWVAAAGEEKICIEKIESQFYRLQGSNGQERKSSVSWLVESRRILGRLYYWGLIRRLCTPGMPVLLEASISG
jgi:hypothetical protein